MMVSNRFEELMSQFEKDYNCNPLEIRYVEMKEESLRKVRFEEEDLHFERGQQENLENGFFEIPLFYEDEEDMPATRNKFFRAVMSYAKGDLIQITANIGTWNLKRHDEQHRDYPVDRKTKEARAQNENIFHLAFNHEKSCWSFLKEDMWLPRKDTLEEALSNPLFREMERTFSNLLNQTNDQRTVFVSKGLTKDGFTLLSLLEELEWYIDKVPKFWATLKLYPTRVTQHINGLTGMLYHGQSNDCLTLLEEREDEGHPNTEMERFPVLQTFDKTLQEILFVGYYVLDGIPYQNPRMMYWSRKNSTKHRIQEDFRLYEQLAVKIAKDEDTTFVFIDKIEGFMPSEPHKKKK
jgi:hypothetical protein